MPPLFAGVDGDGFVQVQLSHEGKWPLDGVGPPSPWPDGPYVYHLITERVSGAGRPSATCKLMWVDGASAWIEMASLPELKAQSIADVDAFGDAARLAVVGHAARIKEYEDAQLGAEQFRDAGYTGPVPDPVASWAHAKRRDGWTDRQAADDILAASARWYAALRGIRAMRLDAKETIKAAETGQEVSAIVAAFRATLTEAMQGVQ